MISLFGRRQRLGLFIGESGASAVFTEIGGPGDVPARVHIELDEPLWGPDDGPRRRLFDHLAKEIPRSARRADVSVHAAIPDSLIREELFEFEAFPEDSVQARELVSWKIAREYRTTMENIACSHERLPSDDDGRESVRVRFMSRQLLDSILREALRAGFPLTRLEGISVWLLGQMRQPGPGSADGLLWQAGTCWTFVCRSHEGCHSMAEGGWLEEGGDPAGFRERFARRLRRFARSRGIEPGVLEEISVDPEIPGIFASAGHLEARQDGAGQDGRCLGDPALMVALH